jgi:hypothetical protein
VFVLAAAAAATCALSACGPVKMGSAAITGGQRLTMTTLSDQVTDLENAVQAGRGKIQLQFPRTKLRSGTGVAGVSGSGRACRP